MDHGGLAPALPDGGVPDVGLDESLGCTPGEQRPCGSAIGACTRGQETCGDDRLFGACSGVQPSEEQCDPAFVDEDCDGEENEGCDCTPGSTRDCGTTEGVCEPGQQTCGDDARWSACDGVSPRIESCNGLDDDCDGSTDEELLRTFYLDEDGDEFGRTDTRVESCEAPPSHVERNGDCNDGDGLIFPGAAERCNGIDDSCDGIPDNGLSTLTRYIDVDGDGFGAGEPVIFCEEPGEGYADNADDCDDSTDEVFPGASEICDGVDNNCSGTFDEGRVCGCFGANYNGHNYLFCDDRTDDWRDARGRCRDNAAGGGVYDMVNFNDLDERNFVTMQARVVNPSHNWWIGLNDDEEEGEWVWIDGRPQRNGDMIVEDFDFFAAGEPNDQFGEDCGEMRSDGLWNDDECNDRNYFICESRD